MTKPGKWGAGPVSIARGTMIVVAMRWTDRAIGLLSTIILARLLVPEDLGVVAMATMAIGLAAVFLDLGVHVALIQNPNPTKAHYDAAWTLGLVQSGCLAAIVWFGAPFAAEYFSDARVVPVLRWLAIGIAVGGFENIGIVSFQKEMRFGLEFRFLFAKRFLSFLIGVAAAWFLRNYWALVIGTLAGKLLGVGLSYAVHPMRPLFSREKIGDIFSVSQWMIVKGIATYLDNNLHRLLVGRWTPAATLGAYSLADEISAMPSTELLAPLNRVLFPGFVRAKDGKDGPGELKRLFLLAQGLQTMIGIPAAVGLALVAPEAVHVLLGERWMAAVPFVQLLALGRVLEAITTSPGYVMVTLGEVRWVAFIAWFRVAVFAALVVFLTQQSNAESLALMRVLCLVASLGLTVFLLRRTFREVSLAEIAATVSRPVLATGVMTIVLVWGMAGLELAPFAALLTKIGVGAIVYSVALLALWRMAGKPAGAERHLATMLLSGLRARRFAR